MKLHKQNYFYILFSFFFAVQIYSAINVRWSDSELWSLALGHITFLTSTDQSFYYKPLFTIINWAITQISNNDIIVIQFARLLYCLVGMVGVYFLVAFVNLKTKATNNTSVPVTALLMLFSCSLFLFQGFRIRSDLIASVLCFIGLYTAEKSKLKLWTVPLMLQAAALLVTPKAILFLSVNLIYIYFSLPKSSKIKNKKTLALVALLPLAGATAAFLYYPYAYSGAWKYLLSTFSESSTRPLPWGWDSFLHLRHFLLENFHLLIVFCFSLFGYKNANDKDWPLSAAAFASVLLIVLFPDRLPFFILSMLFLPMTWLIKYFIYGFNEVMNKIINKTLSKRIYQLLFLSFFTIGYGYWLSQSHLNNNHEQSLSIQTIQGVIGRSEKVNYYDATGVLPTRTKYDLFPAPEQDDNKLKVLMLLKNADINLVFMGQRLFLYFQEALQALESNFFVDVGGGVFAKALIIDAKNNQLIGGIKIDELCELSELGIIHLRAGSNFLNTKPLFGKMLCNELLMYSKTPAKLVSQTKKWLKLEKRNEEFLVLTFVEDLKLPQRKSFSQIFDDDSHFYSGFFNRFFN